MQNVWGLANERNLTVLLDELQYMMLEFGRTKAAYMPLAENHTLYYEGFLCRKERGVGSLMFSNLTRNIQ